jgi:V/A-type H+-transporting ATPase subunit C
MHTKKINPYDYLYASARVRMLSNKVITMGKLYQMIDALNLRQAFRVLNEADIGVGEKPENYEAALVKELTETYATVREITKNMPLFDIFRYGYDGLNIKIALKAKAAGYDPMQTMTDLGTVPKKDIVSGLLKRHIEGLPPEMAYAAEEARTAQAAANDPQKLDITIDKAMLSAMYRAAHEYDNPFFHKVVRSRIDIENIRSLVRIKRAGKDADFLRVVLGRGGYVDIEKIAAAFNGSMRDIAFFAENTRYGPALRHAFDRLESAGHLNMFERVCDNYLLTFIGEANKITFGAEPIVGYIFEKENEITSVRMVMASKMANIPAETITERLREYAR